MRECTNEEKKFPPFLGEGQGGVCNTMRTIRHYTRETLQRGRDLRSNQTNAEKKLWQCLRKGQLEGHKFRRQFFIGKYIADFVCVKQKLAVEVDGGQHSESGYDLQRDAYIRGQGYHILRFWNNDVLSNMEGVMETIRPFILRQTPPQPSPIRGGSISPEGIA